MTATVMTLEPDIFHLRALLDALDPREDEPCEVAGCTHRHPVGVQARQAA